MTLQPAWHSHLPVPRPMRRCRRLIPDQWRRVQMVGERDPRGEIVHIADCRSRSPDTTRCRKWQETRLAARFSGAAAARGEPIGMISVTAEAGRFADQHVELLQTFADQAVIAISECRLFDEVKERTESCAIARRTPRRAGPPDPDRETCLARPAHRGDRARDQEPAQLRQQFLRAFGELTDELNDVLNRRRSTARSAEKSTN